MTETLLQTAPTRGWSIAVKRLTHADHAFPESLRRRIRMLACLLLVLILLTAISLAVELVVHRGQELLRARYAAFILGLMAMQVAAFFVNRAGHYVWAARLTVLFGIIGPWGSAWIDPSVLRGNVVPLTYSTLSVMLCGTLLSARATLALTVLELAAVALLALFGPEMPMINWACMLCLMLFAGAISLVTNAVIQADLKQIEDQARRLAETAADWRDQSIRDPLTGLFNRRYLDETLERELVRAERSGRPIGVIMIDVDHFKQFNDTYGHATGDEVLKRLGGLLRQHSRKSDIACRYGGEEFILVLPDAPAQITQQRAELLRFKAQELDIPGLVDEHEPVTLSVGVSNFPEHGATASALLRSADVALYHAKRHGRNRVVVAE